jgi:hypothetical protein
MAHAWQWNKNGKIQYWQRGVEVDGGRRQELMSSVRDVPCTCMGCRPAAGFSWSLQKNNIDLSTTTTTTI